MIDLGLWQNYVATLDVQPLFVTVSGAHLYGFDSLDSDVDLRGCHLLPLADVIGLFPQVETIERGGMHAGIEVDLVSHDVGKYFRLLVRNNGYVLEQIFSPLVVAGHDFLERLRPIAARCITKLHYHHYRGFYATQRKLLDKEERKRAKSLLYAYRVLLTGIHLLQSGEVEANLHRLNDRFGLPQIADLVAIKTGEREKVDLPALDWEFHAGELGRLESVMEQAFTSSSLGETRDTTAASALLVELRLASKH